MGSSTLSYFHGVSDIPLIGKTINEYLDELKEKSPDSRAIVSCHQNKTYTYKELLYNRDLLASRLISAGIKRGDRVGIWSTNNIEWFVIFLAVAKIGGILVNINPSYRVMELEYALKQSGIKLMFAMKENRSSDYHGMLTKLAPHIFDTGCDVDNSACSLLEKIVFLDEDYRGNQESNFSYDQFLDLDGCMNDAVIAESFCNVQIDDPVNIQYTSGTTGFPKGVTLSHHNLINNAYLAALAMGVNSDSCFCVPMPFYHCGGMISSALATLVVGGTVVIPSAYFQDKPTLQALSSQRCTHISGVPTMFIAQLEHPEFERFDLSSLKSGFMAGAPCPVELMKRVADTMHIPDIVILYGLTESSPLMTATTTTDSLEIRSTTVGKPIGGVEVKIIDTESGEIVERGKQGEICCRGHLVMLGYWNNQEATALAIDESRWLHSGDLGTMSSDGYINITGRIKDMILRGGENIYPREIEEILHKHNEISQAQVFGVPDAKLGEEVCLWVELKTGSEIETSDIRTWLKERISHFKIPKHIKIVSEFPMTVTGKIRKFKMRETMVKELNLESEAKVQTA